MKFQNDIVYQNLMLAIVPVTVSLESNSQIYKLSLVVIKSDKYFVPLLGRNWLDVVLPNWRTCLKLPHPNVHPGHVIATVESSEVRLSKLKTEFPRVFAEDKRTNITGIEAHLVLKEAASMIFHKAYSVSYKIKDKLEKELNSMIDNGILVRMSHAEMASPIVCVPKPNGAIRVCVDFKKTLNPALRTDYYPLPFLDEICQTLVGGKVFTILDLAEAYLQLPVEKKSQHLLTINTHLGLMKFTRLPYGVSSAPAIFQSNMAKLLKGLPVDIYLDDIIIAGRDENECYNRVTEVLSFAMPRLQKMSPN
jgi:hypothetical protein